MRMDWSDATSEQSLRDLVAIVSRLEKTVENQLKFIGSLLFINTTLVGGIIYMAFWR